MIRVVDGDTIDLDVDLGLFVHIVTRVRVLGVDTPERFTPTGREATAFTNEWFTTHRHADALVVRTVLDRTEKYGRYLATITCPNDRSSLADALVRAGHVKPVTR